MSSTFSSLKFELIGSGEQSGTWGNTTNTNIGTAIEQAIVGMATLEAADFTANVCTLTLANTNAAQDARALCLKIDAAALSAPGTVNVPAIQKPYLIINASSYAVTVKVSGQTGVAVPAGKRTVVYNDGTDVGNQISWLSSLTLGTALAVADGGTGATTASGARTNLGLGTIATQAANNVAITGGSITGITDLAVADGGTGASTAANARTNLGLAIGTDIPSPTGTGASGTWGINVTGNAATATNGVVTTGSYADPTWITSLAGSKVTGNISGNAGNVTGTVAVANGGTGATSAAAARTNLGATTVGANLFTLPNPSAIRYVQLNADNTVTVMDAATFRAAIGAGTGGGSVSSVSGTGTVNGITLTGTVTSTGSLTLGGTLSGVSLTTQVTGTLPVANGGTGATSAATARSNLGAGTVNSVSGTGTVNGLTLTGTVTSSGSLTLGGTLSGVSLATQVTGTLPVANGGTGATDAATARSNLGAGTVTSVAGSGTLNGLTLTGTVTGSGNLTLGGTFRFNVQVVGTNTAASANNVYVVTAASVTVTLPGSPTAGDLVGVSNMSGASDITIARNGNNIMALAEDLTVNLDGAGFLLVYADAARGWVLLP